MTSSGALWSSRGTRYSDMVERIRTETVAAARGVVPTYLSEAETDAYPYAVYEFSPEYYRTKDGVYKIAADIPLTVYSKRYGEAVEAAEDIAKAVLSRLVSPDFRAVIASRSDRCVEGVWQIEVRYNITQYI